LLFFQFSSCVSFSVLDIGIIYVCCLFSWFSFDFVVSFVFFVVLVLYGLPGMYSMFLSFMSYGFSLFFPFKSCCYFFVRFCSWCYYVVCMLTWCRLCLYLLMARKLDLIKDIDDKKETLKLVVRVKDLWFVQNRDNSRHIELILLDQKVMQLWCYFMCCCFMCCYFYAFFSRVIWFLPW